MKFKSVLTANPFNDKSKEIILMKAVILVIFEYEAFFFHLKDCYRCSLFNIIGINTRSKDNSIKIFGHLLNAMTSYSYVIHIYINLFISSTSKLYYSPQSQLATGDGWMPCAISISWKQDIYIILKIECYNM